MLRSDDSLCQLPRPAQSSLLDLWCTGKDSNLRTSLGGTDLQSVGFNHSPTCAKPPGDAAVALHPVANSRTRRPWQHTSTLVHQSYISYIFANQTSQIRFSQPRKPRIAPANLPRRSLHAGIFRNIFPDIFRAEVRWKNLLRHLEFRCSCRKFVLTFVSGSSYTGAGEGIRTPDPRFTKPMLYRLSYASIAGTSTLPGTSIPFDPSQMSGTIS